MIWGIWGEWAGAPSTVNRRRISTHRYCGKQCADIIANSVTLCEISSCGYFCGNFAGIGDISDILTVWYFDRSPVNCPGVSWCGLGPPPFFSSSSFVCASIISIIFIVSALLLHVHPLYLIVHVYLTQLRCLTYYHWHYMYTVLFSSSPQMLSPQVWPLRYVTYFY